ncbi:ATP-binding protein, partial [Aeromonas caviae]|uniref:ATP-binding protein n=1 Tax=Aeromonas caviae TaxID=648 RepID=UPI0029DA6299
QVRNDGSKWAPRCQVRIVQVEGDNLKTGKDYNVVNDEIITGNIFSLITNSWNKLRPFLAYKTEFGMEAKFEQKYIYPEEAIREALINAITHRDYSIQNGIDIFIFNNRLEVSSPGRLLSTISIDDLRALKGAHESRNSLISKILRENSFVRELGEGMRRIFSLLESQEMESPILNNAENYFSITFKNKSIYSAKEESYLNIFNKFELTANQKRIVILGIKKDEISPQDIYKAMNTNDRDTYDREVTGLRRHGILVQTRTNPSATILAKKLKITKQAIGRFKIEMPK